MIYCAPEVMARSRAEPLPPAGGNLAALNGWLATTFGEAYARDFWRWWRSDYPGWARDGWRRLDAARAKCPPLIPPRGPP